MSGERHLVLHFPAQLDAAVAQLRGMREYLPIRITVAKYRPTRSRDQNDKLHAMCADVSRQVDWAGHRRTTEDWKRLFVDAYLREHGTTPGVVPSLDGAGVVSLGQQTRRMSVPQMAELIEWISAWGADNGVEWSDDQGGA